MSGFRAGAVIDGYELLAQAPAELSGRGAADGNDGWWSDPWWAYHPERGWACIRWWKPVTWTTRDGGHEHGPGDEGPRVTPWPFREEVPIG